MAPHQPTAPVKALEGRATSNEAAARSHAAASQAWDAQTAADASDGRHSDDAREPERTGTPSSSSSDEEGMPGKQSRTGQQRQARRMRQRREVPPADVRELQQILSGGILVVQVKIVSDLKGKPWWKGGFRKELQMRVTVCGHSKESGIVSPPRRALFNTPQRTIMLRLEVDFELTGEEARREGETVHVEVWDVFLKPEFQGYVDVLLCDVVAQRRLRGEWPLSEVPQGVASLDLSWTATLQRGRIAHSQQQAF
ncbi:g5040 [Coccomyxa elongata]